MKVIFLDVDGVLNSIPTIRQFGHHFIDHILVCLVERIVRETGCSIILSSSWRQDARDKKLVDEALNMQGLSVRDCTPSIMGPTSTRADEIRDWISRNPVEKFAVIDDDDWADTKDGNFFKTDEDRGLTVEIAERVIKHLSGMVN